ncbi:hypothetical protein BKI52_29145 [marine bacterium AO1-C]|nr:hypothetical protein BKI52_29145 [marine bacterium AO1-C]
MKIHSFISALILALLLGWTCAQAQNPVKALDNIHKKADKAFMASFQQGWAPFDNLLNTLEKANQKQTSRYLTYWRAFVHYYASVFALKTQNKEKGQVHNAKALNLLKSIKNKSSDDYVLLAMNTSIGISFDHSIAMVAKAEVESYYEKAFKLNSKNIRAYYAKANSDFYTPKEYGGGLQVESLALKGLDFKDTYSTHINAPAWGREDIYGLLVRYYIREDQKQKALKYCKQGLKKYPDSYELKSNLKKLSK